MKVMCEEAARASVWMESVEVTGKEGEEGKE